MRQLFAIIPLVLLSMGLLNIVPAKAAPAAKAAVPKVQHDRAFYSPTPASQKALARIMAKMPSRVPFTLKGRFKGMVSRSDLSIVEDGRGTCVVHFALKDNRDRVEAVVCLFALSSFLRAPRSSEDSPTLLGFYPARKKTKGGFEIRIATGVVESFVKAPRVELHSAKKVGITAFTLTGKAYTRAGEGTSKLMTVHQHGVWYRGRFNTTAPEPVAGSGKMDGCTSTMRSRDLWVRTAAGRPAIVTRGLHQEVCFDEGAWRYSCSVTTSVTVVSPVADFTHHIGSKQVASFLKANPLLKGVMKSVSGSSKAACAKMKF